MSDSATTLNFLDSWATVILSEGYYSIALVQPMEPVAAPVPCCVFGGSKHSLQHFAPAGVAVLDEFGCGHQKCCIQPVTWYTMISPVRINWRSSIQLPLLVSLPVICSLVSTTITCSLSLTAGKDTQRVPVVARREKCQHFDSLLWNLFNINQIGGAR